MTQYIWDLFDNVLKLIKLAENTAKIICYFSHSHSFFKNMFIFGKIL